LEKFGLKLHPEKTRLVPLGPPEESKGVEVEPPGTFNFLGFTHYWGKSRKGRWIVVRHTSRKRLERTLTRINEWCRENRHQGLRYQVEKLGLKLKGHFGYYGITGNLRRWAEFRWQVIGHWRYWLNRRSREQGSMTWERMRRLLTVWYLPPAKVMHSALVNPCS
jgi:hypothetical protein